MAYIPTQWIPPTDNRQIKVLDLAILLYHVHKGAKDGSVGFEDSRESLDSLTKEMNKKVYVKTSHIESALWSANLMDEAGKFWHPKDLTFDEWIRQMFGMKEYNRLYCILNSEDK